VGLDLRTGFGLTRQELMNELEVRGLTEEFFPDALWDGKTVKEQE